MIRKHLLVALLFLIAIAISSTNGKKKNNGDIVMGEHFNLLFGGDGFEQATRTLDPVALEKNNYMYDPDRYDNYYRYNTHGYRYGNGYHYDTYPRQTLENFTLVRIAKDTKDNRKQNMFPHKTLNQVKVDQWFAVDSVPDILYYITVNGSNSINVDVVKRGKQGKALPVPPLTLQNGIPSDAGNIEVKATWDQKVLTQSRLWIPAIGRNFDLAYDRYRANKIFLNEGKVWGKEISPEEHDQEFKRENNRLLAEKKEEQEEFNNRPEEIIRKQKIADVKRRVKANSKKMANGKRRNVNKNAEILDNQDFLVKYTDWKPEYNETKDPNVAGYIVPVNGERIFVNKEEEGAQINFEEYVKSVQNKPEIEITPEVTPQTPDKTPESKAKKSKLSGGAIAGIVIGCVAFLALAGGLAFWLYNKKN